MNRRRNGLNQCATNRHTVQNHPHNVLSQCATIHRRVQNRLHNVQNLRRKDLNRLPSGPNLLRSVLSRRRSVLNRQDRSVIGHEIKD